MSAVSDQLPALVGVAIGTAGTLLTAVVTDRARWRRERDARWDARRAEAYADYARAIKRLRYLAAGISAEDRPGAATHPIEREAGPEAARGGRRRARPCVGVRAAPGRRGHGGGGPALGHLADAA